MRRKVFIVFVVLFLILLAAGGFFIFRQTRQVEFFRSTLDFLTGEGNELPIGQNQEISALWLTDFNGNRVLALSPDDKIIWQQNMATPPMPGESGDIHAEYVTLASNGNLIVADGDGMMVQEIDRQTHELIWQYGVRNKQGATSGLIHQPDKSFKFNDHEVVINDGNNRRVIIIDQNTNKIVWQYGHTLETGSELGYLRGNTSVKPLNGGKQFIITDTIEKKIIIVDRESKNILWQFVKPDAIWLQHVYLTAHRTFLLEDRQKNEVFEVDGNGKIIWQLDKLADGSVLSYPTDIAELANGNILIAEAGRSRIIEVNLMTKKIVRQWGTNESLGLVTTIVIDYQKVAPSKVTAVYNFVGPRDNISSSTPADYGFWSFAVSVKGVLSRSGQPTISDFQWLRKEGWRGVIDLRVDGERNEVSDDTKIEGFNELGFHYLALPIADGSPPSDEQAQKFLDFVNDPANQPAHVHCRGGIGRTGAMVALYRYDVQGWPMTKAIEESWLFEGGVSESQEKWLQSWSQIHQPAGYQNKFEY